MDALQAMLTRRSIRQFTSQPVPEELVDELLHAAMAAPSAGNQQPWEFVLLRDRSTLDIIPTIHPYAEMVRCAEVVVLVCADTRRARSKGFWPQDCSAAMQNLLLAAHALGLGAVWVGVYPNEQRVESFRKLASLPDEVVPFAIVPLGYPAESCPPSERYDAGRIHYERWGGKK